EGGDGGTQVRRATEGLDQDERGGRPVVCDPRDLGRGRSTAWGGRQATGGLDAPPRPARRRPGHPEGSVERHPRAREDGNARRDLSALRLGLARAIRHVGGVLDPVAWPVEDGCGSDREPPRARGLERRRGALTDPQRSTTYRTIGRLSHSIW